VLKRDDSPCLRYVAREGSQALVNDALEVQILDAFNHSQERTAQMPAFPSIALVFCFHNLSTITTFLMDFVSTFMLLSAQVH
jgi:hypothetical protein